MRILCTLPNASDRINGVTFEPTDDGMRSVEIEIEVAAEFLAIPGYRALTPEPAPEPPVPSPSRTRAAQPE